MYKSQLKKKRFRSFRPGHRRLIIKIRKRRVVFLLNWIVVDFPEEETCEVIPTFWLTDGNHKTFYPQYKGTRFWKAVTTFETPKSYWKHIHVEFCIKQIC
ncbi:uncharacterized protein LOC143907157 isoform X5 [Temnothorax americanus]|uniref:uncharacterized protein LOC143907157 isoform X5 n=1 Tax=Temnothorax americanus TaxID=1964332 RepID=UPI004067E59B